MSASARRGQLLEVARDLFMRDGYRTTTADVADGAGVSQALVIKHFGTKEELFRASVADPLLVLFQTALDEERGRAGAAEDGTPAEHIARLADFGARWTALITAHGPAMLSLMRESVEFPDVMATLMGLVRSLADQLVETLERYGGGEHYRPFDARMATYAALGALTIGGTLMEDSERFAAGYFDMIMHGVLNEAGRASLEPESTTADHGQDDVTQKAPR